MTAVLEPQTPDRVTDLVELYKGRRDDWVRYASRFAGGRDQAEDAVHNAFVKLLTNPEEVRDAAAFVTAQARFRGQDESAHHSRQVPVGDAMDWQPDTAPPAEDLDTLPVCMGDPVVVAAVRKALAKLPARQAAAIRMRMLDGAEPSAVSAKLGVDERTIRRDVQLGLETLRAMNVPLPEIEPPVVPTSKRKSPAGIPTIEELTATLDREHPGEWIGPDPAHETLRRIHGTCSAKRAGIAQQAHNKPLTPPMRIRAGLGPESLAAANAELVATLGREFPGRTVTIKEAEETLRHVHKTCSLGRARQARVEHNAKVSAPEGVSVDTPSAETCTVVTPVQVAAALATAEGNATIVLSPSVVATTGVTQVVAAQGPAPALRPVQPTVAEVWLMGAKPPISCLLVHTDETTANRDLAAVSLPGAQREITGQLIGDGYRPDGPWIDVDPAAPEAMRKFQVSQ